MPHRPSPSLLAATGCTAAVVAAAVILAAPSPAAAQDANREIVFPKVTVMSFTDDTVSGDLSRPDGTVLRGDRRRMPPNLIQVRTSFRAEVLRSLR